MKDRTTTGGAGSPQALEAAAPGSGPAAWTGARHARVAPAGGRVVSIQYLRAFAAMAVVVFHASIAAGRRWGPGAAGVDVFFVISGFIMWMVTERPTTPAAFARNRIARIVPLYWLATAVLAARTRPDAARLVQSLLFIPHRDPAGEIWPVLVPGWTLDYEMFFYAIFACGLLLPRRAQLWFLTAVLLALPAAGIALEPHGAVAATYTNPILCEFLAGVWLSVAWRAGRLPGAGTGWATIAAGAALFTACRLLGLDADAFRVLAWGLPALCLVGGALMIERSRPMPRLPVFTRLGDGSYSIYLFHTLVIAALANVVAPSRGFFLLAVPASAIIGYAVYAAVEKPIEDLRKRPRAAAATA